MGLIGDFFEQQVEAFARDQIKTKVLDPILVKPGYLPADKEPEVEAAMLDVIAAVLKMATAKKPQPQGT